MLLDYLFVTILLLNLGFSIFDLHIKPNLKTCIKGAAQ